MRQSRQMIARASLYETCSFARWTHRAYCPYPFQYSDCLFFLHRLLTLLKEMRGGRIGWGRKAASAMVWVAMLACSAAPFAIAGQESACPPAVAKPETKPEASQVAADRPKSRVDAVRALAARLGVGPGSVVADLGAGKGQDTWVFADVVGPSGVVYAEEITEGLVDSLRAEAEKRKLAQVRAVLGREDSPELPASSLDLAYMRYVYHHVSKPREMLRGIWQALKPGGYFVVVDRQRGTLRDWVPREQRKTKHFWLAETTVVREAREEGFAFVACAEECCEAAEPFVLVFQRPGDLPQPGRDPDPFLPLPVDDVARRLLPSEDPYQHPVFIALGEARQLMRPILAHSTGQGLEIVLEEWATQKDERPPLPEGVSLPSVLTEQGDPHLGPEPISAVFFLDSYHLLFHAPTLLAKLQERLAPGGRIYVLDREAKQPLSRREASHRRQIAAETVKQEMTAAGFCLSSECPRPAPDRFLLLFCKRVSEQSPGK